MKWALLVAVLLCLWIAYLVGIKTLLACCVTTVIGGVVGWQLARWDDEQ